MCYSIAILFINLFDVLGSDTSLNSSCLDVDQVIHKKLFGKMAIHLFSTLLLLLIYSPCSGRFGLPLTLHNILSPVFLSRIFSLSNSSSSISASTLSNHAFLGLPTDVLPSTQYISSPSPHHMSISSQSTTSNESCDMLFNCTHLYTSNILDLWMSPERVVPLPVRWKRRLAGLLQSNWVVGPLHSYTQEG